VAWAGTESEENKSTVVIDERRTGEEEASIAEAKQQSNSNKLSNMSNVEVEPRNTINADQ
jgi:hypothetical protein